MHHSAKRGIATACPPSVRLSVCLSVTLVDKDHRLEILETRCTDN